MELPSRRPTTVPRDRVGSWTLDGVAGIRTVRNEASALCARDPQLHLPDDYPVLAGARERLALILTELVANALHHARPPIAVTLESAADSWLLTVSDGSPDAPPRRSASGSHDRRGRGLAIVTTLAPSCGWFVSSGTKVVWVELPDLPSPELVAALTNPQRPD